MTWSLELILETSFFCSSCHISITWHFCSHGPKLLDPVPELSREALVILAWCFVPWRVLIQPAQPREKQLRWWGKPKMRYTEWEGTKHSNELCCTLVPACLTRASVSTERGCGLSPDQLAAVPHAKCFQLPPPAPEAGAATGRFGLCNGGAVYVVWAVQYAGLWLLMEMALLFLCKMS